MPDEEFFNDFIFPLLIIIENGNAIATTQYYFLQNSLQKKSRYAEFNRKTAKTQRTYFNRKLQFFSLHNFNKKT